MLKSEARLMAFQITLAVILSALVFYIFSIGFAPRQDGNNYPLFMATSQSHYYPIHQAIPTMWNSRALACTLSSAWFDFWRPNQQNWVTGRATFASFHTLWVFIVFLLLIFTVKKAWFPMVGITIGIICNSIAFWPPFFLPWDMPAMLFFTAAYLCYRKKKWAWLIAVIFAGAFIKETVMLCAFFFLGAPWKWRDKVIAIIGIPMLATLFVKLTLPPGTAPAWYYSITEWFSHITLDAILDNAIILLANGGGLLALLFCLKQSKDWPLRIVCATFIIGQCLNNIRYGWFNEFRVWCELLPLGWILMADFIFEGNSAKQPKENSIIAAA